MFETSIWSPVNRRAFAAIECLYQQVGSEMPASGTWEGSEQFSAALCHRVGINLLVSSISVGTAKSLKFSGRRERKAWRQITPEAGARAAVFLTMATGSMLSEEFEPNVAQEAVTKILAVLYEDYEPEPTDLDVIGSVRSGTASEIASDYVQYVTERGGTVDKMVIECGQAALSHHALKIAGLDPDSMPAFANVSSTQYAAWSQIEAFEWKLETLPLLTEAWDTAKDGFVEQGGGYVA